MKKTIFVLVFSVFAALSALSAPASAQQASTPTAKVAIVVLQFPNPGPFRRALEYAVDLKKAGVETTLIFDGSGVRWLAVLEKMPEAGKLKKKPAWGGRDYKVKNQETFISIYEELKSLGVPMEASYGALDDFGWKEDVSSKKNIKASKAAASGKMNISSYVLSGWQVWVF